jgi:peptide chain release factor 1
MVDKLESIKQRYLQVEAELSGPDAMADMKQFSKLNKEYKDLSRIVEKYEAYKLMLAHQVEARNVLETEKDPDFRDMAKIELDELYAKIEEIEGEITTLLIPKDPNDSKNAILELRAGAGGDEASIFAGDLFRMYSRFAERMGWKFSVMDAMEGTSGGYKEITVEISGEDVYGKMKYESGVHRVQRVPATETAGRIHTSAATVAVLPEVDDVEVTIDMNDVRKDLFCASGPGGQSVNTTYSAVRLTHIPTGLVVSMQDEKSQHKNFEKALKILRSRIYDAELARHNAEIGAQRKAMIGSGDRSEKIRTYNYPQSRVTDHRIGYTVHNLPTVMEGYIEDFIEQLRITDNAERMGEGVAMAS